MKYYINKTIEGSFEKTIGKVTELLKEQGFGIITEIDIKETLKKKINKDFKKYTILGACNPHFSYQALQLEDLIGALLPCNVIVVEQAPNTIEVAAMDAANALQITENSKLQEIAVEVNNRLKKVIDQL